MRPIRPFSFHSSNSKLQYFTVLKEYVLHNHQWMKIDIPPSLGIMVRKTNGVPLLSDLCQANYSPTLPLSQTSSSACERTRKSYKTYLTRVPQQFVNAG
jgi:hypothetical protein